MNKYRVLIDIFYLHVAQTGIRTYILSLCDTVSKHSSGQFEYITSPDLDAVLKARFFKGKTSKWRNLYFQILYFLRKQIVLPILSFYYRADLTISPDILSPIVCRGKKVSVIHDTFFWDTPDHYHPLWLKYYLFFLKKSLSKNAGILTVSQFSKYRLKKLGLFDNCKIQVAHTPVRFSNQFEVTSSPPPDYPFFLHVGVLEKRKNIGMLIEAFSMLKKSGENEKLKLVLIGQRGPREHLDDWDNLQALVDHFGIRNHVLFLGYLTYEELSTFYSYAVGYVFPSLNEGFGLPVLEAFSFGLPVIISDQGALKEIAGGSALVLPRNSAHELMKAMDELLKNQELREQLTQKGQKRLSEFTTGKFFINLENALIEILNE